MANWCFNTIVFEGNEETIKQIEKLFQAMKSKEEQTKQGQLPEFITDENGGYFFNVYSNEGDTGILWPQPMLQTQGRRRPRHFVTVIQQFSALIVMMSVAGLAV